jgi:hypothetical protein
MMWHNVGDLKRSPRKAKQQKENWNLSGESVIHQRSKLRMIVK